MGELIFRIFGEWVIIGIWALISSIYDWTKGKIFGIPKNEVERKRLEKKWLYKKVILKKKQENGLDIGIIGTVMEIIDKKNAFIEFYDKSGEFIKLNDKLMFKIRTTDIRLKK